MFTGIKFKGYKLFSEDNLMEIENISNVNVIIGKNNSGKSSLLDIIETVYDNKKFDALSSNIETLIIKFPITNSMVHVMFRTFDLIGDWTENEYWNEVKDKTIELELGNTQNSLYHKYRFIGDQEIPMNNNNRFHSLLDFALEKRRKYYCFKRLFAERNILPENESEINLSETGEGASNLIRAFLNYSDYDENAIEGKLLKALNEIMFPEAEFESIRIQQIKIEGNPLWEVFLKEKNCERVPLSKSGSGIKTIILVLLNLLVVPLLDDNKNKKIVYGFEELENNLHPAMQRKLFDFIYNYAVENDTYIFLTTHSHIAINTFYSKERANIYHVVKNDKISYVKKIESYLDKTEILNDLDVKASDLLQSNGIIWVEGPSDRIYIKRWLEVFCDNNFEEGVHYQFLYYGGRLLSQYSAQEETELINIITTNRNAAIVIDSDKRYQSDLVNNTKKRIEKEFDDLNMFSWVTKGKEIENYIPKEALSDMLNLSECVQCGKYELFPDYIKPYYNNFTNKKVPFANCIKDYITRENSKNILDLKTQVEKLYSAIKSWNE